MSKKNKGKKARKAARCAGVSGAANTGDGLFGDLGAWLRKRPSGQFLFGAAVGAAAIYVLSHEDLRARILKGGVELYGSLAGGLAELREQLADIKAEVEAEKAWNDEPA